MPDPGDSNIASASNRSMTVRKPRAPVPIFEAVAAIACKAAVVKRISMLDREKSCWYCFRRLFRGSVRTFTRASTSKDERAQEMGIRPTSSGIRPNFCRS